MRITEGQLRRIIREELNEMGMTYSAKPGMKLPAGERIPLSALEPSGMSDFPGEGGRLAAQVREPRIKSVGDPAFLRRELAAGGYYEDEPEGEEYDPEDPYGGMPRGSRIPGGMAHTAGFKPGQKKRLFGID